MLGERLRHGGRNIDRADVGAVMFLRSVNELREYFCWVLIALVIRSLFWSCRFGFFS